LDEEEKAAIDKAEKTINVYQKREEEIAKIIETFAVKKEDLARQEADAEIQIKLAGILGQRHLIETDSTRTEADKKKELLELLNKEQVLLKANIKLYEDYVRIRD